MAIFCIRREDSIASGTGDRGSESNQGITRGRGPSVPDFGPSGLPATSSRALTQRQDEMALLPAPPPLRRPDQPEGHQAEPEIHQQAQIYFKQPVASCRRQGGGERVIGRIAQQDGQGDSRKFAITHGLDTTTDSRGVPIESSPRPNPSIGSLIPFSSTLTHGP